MFDADDKRKKRPLLMGSNDASPGFNAAGQPHHANGGDMASAHRAARKKRLGGGHGSLASALGRQNDAERNIDADIETLMTQAHAQQAPTQQAAMAPVQAQQAPPPPYPYYMPANDPGYQTAPLIDAASVLTTVWKWRWAIVGSTILGGALGVGLAMSMPKQYTAFTSVLVDPREIKLIDRDLTPEFLANEAALSIIDSRLQLAKSTRVLERVVERTNLSQDGEFNGEGSGLGGGLSIVTGLLSGSDSGGAGKTRITQENLRKAIITRREMRTFVVNIGATSRNAEKSAILANEVAAAFIEEQSGITSRTAADANQKLAGRLDGLRAGLETAERNVENFRTENNLVNAQGRLINDDEIIAVNAALVKARGATSEARARADALRGADLNSVVTGVLPTALVTPALTTFRAQLASLKQQVASLENQLGPRHPRLENMRASAQAASNDIQSELNRIVTGAQADLRSAIQNEQQTAQKLAQLKATYGDNSNAVVALRELEREATAARTIYEAALVRARETGELEAVNQGNATIISSAEAPLSPSSTSRKVVIAGSSIAGFALSTGLALMFGIANSLKTSIGMQGSAPAPSQAPVTPSAPLPSPSGGTRVRDNDDDEDYSNHKSNRNEKDDMYPPYPPYGYPVHAAAPQPMAPQYPSPYGGYPQQAPMMQPSPYMQQPMHHMMQPMMQPMPQMHYPQQPPVPQIQPVFMPIMQQPAAQPAPAPQPMPAPAPAPLQTSYTDQREMDSLRDSVRDIRGVLEQLTQRRYG